MWGTPQRNEQLVAAWAGTRTFFRIVGWALTLALGLGNLLSGSPLHFSTLPQPLSVPAALLAAALPAVVCLPPGLAGAPTPPAIRRILTRRTAVPCLRPLRLKEPFASLQ
ncbi:MAG: hypothetical protein FJZ96_13370 [Chloroflexi bacterium]|nr:hypothetical protein [Chloroflexota bacterium]